MDHKTSATITNTLGPLTGRTVIVTAGNRGGGAVIAKRYATAGANVVIIASQEKEAISDVDQISKQITAAGGQSITLVVDLTDLDAIKTAVATIISHFGHIDILINNFSIFNFKNTLQTTPEEFNQIISNIFATFFFSQACIPYLEQVDNPHVINISPPLDMEAAQAACEHHLLFSISKYGMSLCTLGMAAEFKNRGIAFNSLWQERPIATQTVMTNFNSDVLRGSNKAEIYAEAAYLISLKPAKTTTGNYYIDENVLREAGMDVNIYAVDPNAKPVKDIFLPGVDYSILSG